MADHRVKPTEQKSLSSAIWWEVEGRDCTISIERRPSYCDRGNYIAKLHPTGALALDIDSSDGWPRYYFDWDRMVAEVNAWLEKRNQLPSTD